LSLMACHTTSSPMTRSCSSIVSMDSSDPAPAIDRLARCSTAVRLWFLQNGLQLNADKSESYFLGTAAQLRSAANITTADVAGSTLHVAPQLKSLGVTIDSNLRSTATRETLRRRVCSTLAPCATCAVY